MRTNDIDDLQDALNAYKHFEDMAHEIAQECSALFVNYKACAHERIINKEEQEFIVLQSMKTAVSGVAGLFHEQAEKLTAKIDAIKSGNNSNSKVAVKKFEVGKTYKHYHATGEDYNFVVTARYGSGDDLYIVIDNKAIFKIIGIVDGVEVAADKADARIAANDNINTAYTPYINV